MKNNSLSLPKFSYGTAIVVLCLFSTFVCLSLFARTPRLRSKQKSKAISASHSQTLSSSATGTATFNGIGFLAGDNDSQVRAVNADGSVAVGASGVKTSNINTTGRLAVQWTTGGGIVALPAIPSDGTNQFSAPFISASDITPDGSWIAYRARPGGNGRREAVICSGDFTQVFPLGRLAANRSSVANQISDDGSVAFGFADDINFYTHAFRWTQATGMQQLVEPPVPDPANQYPFTVPSGRACASDGSISVGFTAIYDLNTGDELAMQAYRWTQSGGMELLGHLPGGNRSDALAITADGSLIFGVANSTAHPGSFTPSGNFWNYDGELFLWTQAGGMTSLGAPAGYDQFSNFAGITGDGALLCVVAADSTHTLSDSFFVIKTATGEAFDAYDLLVAAGAGADVSGWSHFSPFGISDIGDTLFGAATDPNGLSQGWVANFPADYLRNVQTFSASSSGTNVNISEGGFIGRDGSYSSANLTIGGTSGPITPRARLISAPSGSGASLTLSGTATLSVNGTLAVDPTGALNLLGASTVTAQALNIAGGGLLGVELDAAAETLSRIAISNGPIDLTGQPTLNLILTYAPAGGTEYSIIQNNSGQAIQGQFAGLPENGTVLAGTRGLRATYAGGASGQDFVLTVLPPPPLVGVVSQMTNIAGTFGLPLPLTGTPGIECRSSVSLGVGKYTVVFTFVNNLVSVGSASVTSGTGSVASTTMDQDTYTVNLTGVTNAQTITIKLASAIDSQNNAGDIEVPMSILIGDTTANGQVNASDVAQTQSQSGQTITSANAREDVTADGQINSSDVALVQSKSGTGLP